MEVHSPISGIGAKQKEAPAESRLEGATAPSYAPPTDIAGAYTYYCVVTNTNPKATGSKTASTTTPAVTVTVLEHSEDCNGGPDCPSYHFTDVDAGIWHHFYVDYVVSHQLMNGISETIFAPDSTLTRAMLAQILYNAEGAPASDRSADFGDVDSDAWYYKAIAFVSSEGLMGGYGDGQFGPDDFITREQLVTTLYRYAEKTGKPVTAAGDLTGFPGWCKRLLLGAACDGVGDRCGAHLRPGRRNARSDRHRNPRGNRCGPHAVLHRSLT